MREGTVLKPSVDMNLLRDTTISTFKGGGKLNYFNFFKP